MRTPAVLAAALLLPLLGLSSAQADYFKRVPVRVTEKDEHTLFLATFDKGTAQADSAAADAAMAMKNCTFVDGTSGKAVRLGTGGAISIPPKGNLLARAGTIELVVRDGGAKERHSLVAVGDGVNATRWLWAQLDNALWFSAGGASPWVRDLDLREDFAGRWMYVVLAWDTAQKRTAVAVYTMEGRVYADKVRYFDEAPMKDADAAQLAAGQVGTIAFGGRDVTLDAVRISNVFRADLVTPQRDWGPVEQWSNYSGASRFFTTETLLKEWRAGREPAEPTVANVEPAIRDAQFKVTPRRKPAVPAWRCPPGGPAFDLDLGTLDIGCYVVRVIAMVRTEDIEQYRKPVYVDLRVNDRVGGAESWYRHRVPYWDDFYAVTELYFNADEKRPYRARLSAGKGGLADLYIHSIEFHDALKGLAGRAVKKGPSLFTPEEREQLRRNADPKDVVNKVAVNVGIGPMHLKGAPDIDGDERAKRDDVLWNALPPLNSQFVAEYDETAFFSKEMRCSDRSVEEAAKEYGSWEIPGGHWTRWWSAPLKFTNEKLKLSYTREDLEQHKPLPDPYPFKDDGLGVYFPATDKDHARHFLPLAQLLGQRWEACWMPLAGWHGNDLTYRLPYLYHALGNRNAARDAALLLCRWAWTYPTHTDQQSLGYALISPASMYNRDLRLRTRALMFYWGSDRGSNLQQGLTLAYDYLFDYINGNQELARAVGRYLPWVRTDEDVRRLIETRILQFGAKQSMLFYLINSKSHSVYLLRTAVVQQDAGVTRPWMESLWRNTHIYPHPNAGLPQFVSTTTQRDGTTDIGSVFYTWSGSPFMETVALTHRYALNGGDARFDLSGPEFGAKLNAACAFPLDASAAGGYPLTIGDVGGPMKPRMLDILGNFADNFRLGFQWTGRPEFAWLIRNHLGRSGETDAEWRAVEDAAARQVRSPFLAQRSRVLADWAGILESGHESDDFRFKRAVHMRVGYGVGHAHADTLDLQVFAHGARMLNDVGWRGEYAQPGANETVLHNLVEINGTGGREAMWLGHAWIASFGPTPGAQYMEGVAVPPDHFAAAGVKHRSRAVALIDADDGVPGLRPPAPLPYTDRTLFDPAAVTPNSYLFDVQRVSGGTLHTFCFHGTISDRFDADILDRTETTPKEDASYLRKWLSGPGMRAFGTSPEVVTATWRLRRTEDVIEAVKRDGSPVKLPQTNAEKYMLGVNYDEKSPPRFTRLRLFGHGGEHMIVAHFQPTEERVKDCWPFLLLQRKGTAVESVYPSLIEPYVGDPFIIGARALDVPGNETDALRAVALEVRTRNGRTDLCFSDGRSKVRQVGPVRVEGRFACVSRDAQGLRLATLVEGRELALPEGVLRLPSPSLTARVGKVDYFKRRVWLDGLWPVDALAGEQVELGNAAHRTSFTVSAARVETGRTVLELDKAIDLSYAAVTGVLAPQRRVAVNVAPVGIEIAGRRDGLTCTNEAMDRSWKCRYYGQLERLGSLYQLEGDVTERDFPVGSVLRVWEFGPGDEARLAVRAAVRRGADGTLKLETNAKAEWTAVGR